ncbi:MAG: transcriptional repressor [Leptospirales bacterium]|nr:transcriptional repressor [Leptospirales bacterium]
MEAFAEICRKHGVKVTMQRRAIYQAVQQEGDHPTVDAVFQRLHAEHPSISRDTVYRTLSLFERWKLLGSVQVGGDGLRYDLNTERHHHFVCDSCGALFDFPWSEFDALRLPAAVKHLGAASERQLQIRGTCKRCQSRPKNTRQSRAAPRFFP